MTKRCTKCGEDKPLDAYYRKGREAHCKACYDRAVVAWRAAHRDREAERRRREQEGSRERRAAYARAYRMANPGRETERARRYRERFPEKYAAKMLVTVAVRSGVLCRPDRCARCGEVVRVQAHHHDYARPLEVEWLCQVCHGRLHWGRAALGDRL